MSQTCGMIEFKDIDSKKDIIVADESKHYILGDVDDLIAIFPKLKVFDTFVLTKKATNWIKMNEYFEQYAKHLSPSMMQGGTFLVFTS